MYFFISFIKNLIMRQTIELHMFVLNLYFIFICLVYSQDICTTVNCGSGVCLLTQNAALPYFCRCPSGSNTILPCPLQNPCSRNPCGQGICEAVPSLLHGYLCRCPGEIISLTSCNVSRSGCQLNPCVNGICIEGISTYFCNCLPTWTGRLCDVKIKSPCLKNPCNLGKCFELNDPNIPFVCLCPNGQFGISCPILNHPSLPPRRLTTTQPTTTVTTRIRYQCNPFETNSCKNGGSCLQTAYNYRCLCSAGFTGTFCELNINECASNPCQHGGICYDLQASYMCYCPDGHFRKHCSPRSIQTSTARTLYCPCQNGGVCSVSGSPICKCPSSFTGTYCEKLLRNIVATASCRRIQCANGGTCVESISGSSVTTFCTCKNGYTGKYCEIEYFQCRSNGRFVDSYNCAQGKYFECIYYQQNIGSNSNGLLLSRSCPALLRFNSEQDRCDYPHNVKCPYN